MCYSEECAPFNPAVRNISCQVETPNARPPPLPALALLPIMPEFLAPPTPRSKRLLLRREKTSPGPGQNRRPGGWKSRCHRPQGKTSLVSQNDGTPRERGRVSAAQAPTIVVPSSHFS
jgi:hypothetical protein